MLSKNEREPLHSQLKKPGEHDVCEKCGEEMEELQVCHLRCPNCGNELTCSD